MLINKEEENAPKVFPTMESKPAIPHTKLSPLALTMQG